MSFRKRVVYVYSDIELVFWRPPPPSRQFPNIDSGHKHLKISHAINSLVFLNGPGPMNETTCEKSSRKDLENTL